MTIKRPSGRSQEALSLGVGEVAGSCLGSKERHENLKISCLGSFHTSDIAVDILGMNFFIEQPVFATAAGHSLVTSHASTP